METKEFDRFVASQQESDVDANLDRAQIRDEWLADLDSLHKQIAGFLQDYINKGSISYGLTKIQVTEPDLGTYLANRMDITIGRKDISLIPVGTLLVACKGRVDAKGSEGRAQMLLVNANVRTAADLVQVRVNVKDSSPSAPTELRPVLWSWKILTNTVQKKFVDLDKESFFALLMEISGA